MPDSARMPAGEKAGPMIVPIVTSVAPSASQAEDVALLSAERRTDADLVAALRHRIRRDAGQSDRSQDQTEHADQTVSPRSRLERGHELRDLFACCGH